jgi:hypothetical protein
MMRRQEYKSLYSMYLHILHRYRLNFLTQYDQICANLRTCLLIVVSVGFSSFRWSYCLKYTEMQATSYKSCEEECWATSFHQSFP